MKVAVIADTHSGDLPEGIVENLKKADLILHAGDICEEQDLVFLRKLNKVEAVCGNMDETALHKNLQEKRILKLGRFNVGMFHGRGPSRSVLNVVKDVFRGDDVDVVVFGHSHKPFNEVIDKVLYFNPGCANACLCYDAPCSYGMLHISDDSIVGEIIEIDA